MANIGDKFVIEIEDVLTSSVDPAMHRYRIKGFASLVFDDYGLGKLTPYTAPVEEPEPEPPTFQKGDEVNVHYSDNTTGKALYMCPAVDGKHYLLPLDGKDYFIVRDGKEITGTGRHFDFGGGAWN